MILSGGEEAEVSRYRATVQASLQGDQRAQQDLERLVQIAPTMDQTSSLTSSSSSPLLSSFPGVWRATLHLLPSSPPPIAYFLASLLKRSIRLHWSTADSGMRAQLLQGTWQALMSYAGTIWSSKGLDGMVYDPGLTQLVLVVAAAAMTAGEGGAGLELLQACLTDLKAIDNSGGDSSCWARAVVALLVLSGLAQEAQAGFGDVAIRDALHSGEVVNSLLAGVASLWPSSSTLSPSHRLAVAEASATSLTQWAKLGCLESAGAMSWGLLQGIATGFLAENISVASIAGLGVKARRRAVESAVSLLEAILVQEDDYHLEQTDQAPPGSWRIPGPEKDAAMGSLIELTVGLLKLAIEAPGDQQEQEKVQSLHQACRWCVAFLRRERHWLLRQSQGAPLALLDLLLQGSSYPNLSVSRACIEVWPELHKVGLNQRAPPWGESLYRNLLPILVQRAKWCMGQEKEEDLDEEEWQEFREQSLYEALYRCYDIMRAGYLETALQQVVSITATNITEDKALELEAWIFSLRIVMIDASRRALLTKATPNALQNTAKVTRNCLGIPNLTPDDISRDAHRTLEVLDQLTRVITTSVAPAAMGPSHTSGLLGIGLARLGGGLGPLLVARGDPVLTRQVLSMLLGLVVESPASRPFAVEATRNVCVRCLAQLASQRDVLDALAQCLHHSLSQGILDCEQAATLSQPIARLIQPSSDQDRQSSSGFDPWSFLREAVLDSLGPLLFSSSTATVPPSRIASILQALSTILRQAPPPLALQALAHTHEALFVTFPASTCAQTLQDLAVGSAYYDLLTRALALPLSLRHRGSEDDYATFLTQTWQAATSLAPHHPVAFVSFVMEAVEAWGPVREAGGMAGLLAQGMELAGSLVQSQGPEVFDDLDSAWFDCGNTALRYCPRLVLDTSWDMMHRAARAATSQQTHHACQAAMVLLTTLVDLPEALPSYAQEQDRALLETRWNPLVAGLLPELTKGLVNSLLGMAPEPTLDALCQLLRALLLRFPVASANQLLDMCPRAYKDPILRDCLTLLVTPGAATPLTDLTTFRDWGCEVWQYCQGKKGPEGLRRFFE